MKGICDQKVFKEIYIQWHKPLQVFLQARGLDKGNAADKTQESFLRLWKNCASVARDKAKSFLFTTASRLQIDDFRKNKLSFKYKQSTMQAIELEDGQYQLEMKEFKKSLEDIIGSMTEASREVFMMNRYQDMKYREIAEALDISVKAVEKRMSKALRHLIDNNIYKKKR
jgi:RNA polymerase sigma-70 factor (ECF subfamily)